MTARAHEPALVEAVRGMRAALYLAVPVVLAAFALAVALSPHWLSTLVGSALIAVIWSAGMVFMSRYQAGSQPPPLRVTARDLPPTVSPWRHVAWSLALITFVCAGAVLASAFWRPSPDFLTGITLGYPVLMADQLRRTRRAEQRLGGTLWVQAGLAWKGRQVRYLSVAPAGE